MSQPNTEVRPRRSRKTATATEPPHPDYVRPPLAALLRGESIDTVPSDRGVTLAESIREFCSEQWGKYATFVVENGVKRREHANGSNAIYDRFLAEDLRQGKPRPRGIVRFVPVGERNEYDQLVQPQVPLVGWQHLFDARRELAFEVQAGRLRCTGFPHGEGARFVEITPDAWRCAEEPTLAELLSSEVVINGERFVDVRFREVEVTAPITIPPAKTAEVTLGPPLTGFSGAPRKTSKELLAAELERRSLARTSKLKLRAEAEALLAWLASEHPEFAQVSLGRVENLIREQYVAWKAEALRRRAAAASKSTKSTRRSPRN